MVPEESGANKINMTKGELLKGTAYYNITKNYGSIYILQFTNNYIKIGKSQNPKKRIKSIISSLPFDYKRYYISKGIKDYHLIEKYLHNHFKDKKIKSEYFKCKFDDIINILENKIGSNDYNEIYQQEIDQEYKRLVNENRGEILFEDFIKLNISDMRGKAIDVFDNSYMKKLFKF